MRYLGIDVTLYAMHCFFSHIRCCGNVLQQFAVQQRRLPCCLGNVLSKAMSSRLQLSGVISQLLMSMLLIINIVNINLTEQFFERKRLTLDISLKCQSYQHMCV
jgi:hypothetical protein